MIRLPRERLEEVAALLARRFGDNPNFVELLLEERSSSHILPYMFAADLGDALGFGQVYIVRRGVGKSAGDELIGAVGLLPGGFLLSVGNRLRALPGMASMLAAPRSARRIPRHTRGIARLHLAQRYWYLAVVGVDPLRQGLSIGTRLQEQVLADRTGQACYLETATERNADWYRGPGIEVGEAGVRFVPEGPPNWTMIRLPIRDRKFRGAGWVEKEEKRGEPQVAHEERYPATRAPCGVLPLTRRSALKACRCLPGYPAGSRIAPQLGADGIVRERSCSDATPDDGVLKDRN